MTGVPRTAMRITRASHGWSAFVFAGLFLVAGCSHSPEPSNDGWVESLQSAHARADAAQTPGARLQAVKLLERAASQLPSAGSPQVRWVRQDLSFRIGQLYLDLGDLSHALGWVERGLTVDVQPTLARANLLALQGKILEAQGERGRAAQAYHAALLINETLMDAALRGESEPSSAESQ